MDASGFDWDEGNWTKCQRHGVTPDEIEQLFTGPFTASFDKAHSASEQRFQAFGRNRSGRAMLVVFTLRLRDEDQFIRPISARYMHEKEVAYYEKEAPRVDDR